MTSAVVLALGATFVATTGAGTASAASAMLDRAPYLTDLTSTSVEVVWATVTPSTSPSTDEARTAGWVIWGTDPACQNGGQVAAVPSGITGTSYVTPDPNAYVQHVATLTGLTPSSTYCYRVWTGGSTGRVTDLLAGDTTWTTSFTTLPTPGTTPSSPVRFAVLGDWGDTRYTSGTARTANPDQANVLAQVAASGARFAVSTGDVAYNDGSPTNYGDLLHTGDRVSDVFGPTYWPAVGARTPFFGVLGNHGRNNTFLRTWPQTSTVAASGGQYTATYAYPSVDGFPATSAPAGYYAVDVGTARLYVLDVDWNDGPTPPATSTATGSLCQQQQPTTVSQAFCTYYQYEADTHWAQTSAQYQWLKNDLAAHPGGVKLAFFHYPIRSDNATERTDFYLQNSPQNPGAATSLEKLLADGGVRVVFNGHTHLYERNVSPPNGVISYISGGGGGALAPVYTGACSPLDAYARGWSPTSNAGSACGTPSDLASGTPKTPTTAASVYHFLMVGLDGNRVSVTPTDSTGRTFDPVTYDFSADTTAPAAWAGNAAPTLVTGTNAAGAPTVKLTWTATTDNLGVHAYDIWRDGAYVTSVPANVLTWTDLPGTLAGHAYQVKARDLAGNTVTSGTASTSAAPGAPQGLSAVVGATAGSVALVWQPPTVGAVTVTGYRVYRAPVTGGTVGTATALATLGAATTAWTDTAAVDGTTYQYTVTALSGGVESTPSTPVQVLADWTVPGTPTGVTATASGTSVTVTWTAPTDNSGSVDHYTLVRTATTGSVSVPVTTTTTLPTVPGGTTTFTDSALATGNYAYTVSAVDAAGNASPASASASAAVGVLPLVADSFDAGAFGVPWAAPATGALAVTPAASLPGGSHSGGYVVREVNSPSWISANLPGTAPTRVHASAWVRVNSRSTSAGFLKLKAPTGAYLAYLYVNGAGFLSVRNDAGLVTHVSGTTVPTGTWVQVEVWLDQNPGGAISLRAALNGTPVAFTGANAVQPGETLGSNGFGKLIVGDDVAARTYDVSIDDVLLDTAG